MAIYPRLAFMAVLVFFTVASHTVNAVATTPVAADANSDPLPPGVVGRQGTPRLRHDCTALAWAPDGQTLASAEIRAARTLESLERAGSTDSVAVLGFLAKKSSSETAKQQAKAALASLKRRAAAR